MHPPLLRNKLIAYLRQQRGQWATRADLLRLLYDGREDGGPENPDNVLQVLMSQIRRRGIPIEKMFVYRIASRRDR